MFGCVVRYFACQRPAGRGSPRYLTPLVSSNLPAEHMLTAARHEGTILSLTSKSACMAESEPLREGLTILRMSRVKPSCQTSTQCRLRTECIPSQGACWFRIVPTHRDPNPFFQSRYLSTFRPCYRIPIRRWGYGASTLY